MSNTDVILSFPNTARHRRAHESVPERGDDWAVSGFRLIPDWGAGTLKVTGGEAAIEDGGTFYWVESATYTGLSIPVGTSTVHYTIDTSGAKPTGEVTVGGSPSEPSLAVGAVDASAETTAERNRTPSEEFGSVSTGDAVIDYPSRIGHKLVAGSEDYPTIQSAIDAIETKGDGARFPGASMQEVIIPPQETDWNEAITVDKKHTALTGQRGQGTNIEQGGDQHTITTTENDIRLSYLGVGHSGSGAYDAIHLTGPDEVTIEQCTVDYAPRYALYVDSVSHCYLDGFEATGGGGGSIRISAGWVRATNLKLQDPVNYGMFISGGAHGRISGTIEDTQQGYGLKLDENANNYSVDVTMNSLAAEGIIVLGDENRVEANIVGATDEAVLVGGSRNVVLVNTDGDVLLQSGASDNVITGRAGGTVTDNGTGNDTTNLA